jgi:hypothetical protein
MRNNILCGDVHTLRTTGDGVCVALAGLPVTEFVAARRLDNADILMVVLLILK